MIIPPSSPHSSEHVTDDFWSKAVLGGILATCIGMFSALLLAFITEPWVATGAPWLGAGVAGVIAGAIQGAFIRHYTRPRLLWLAINSSAWLVAVSIAVGMSELWPAHGFASLLCTTALVGAIIGSGQWLLLRRTQPDTVWWILVHASIWVLLLLIAFVLVSPWLGVMLWDGE